MVLKNSTLLFTLFVALILPASALAQSVDDLLDSDQSDAELFDNTAQPANNTRTAERPARRLDTVLLDVLPVNSGEGEAQAVYDAVLDTIRQAEDLGEISGRLELGSTIPEMHPMEKCRSIDNKRCIRQTGMDINARYLIYGALRDMDDVYLIELELMDVRGGQVLQEVSTQIVKPSTRLSERASEAACRLTRMYGCDKNEVMTGGAAAVAAPMPIGSDDSSTARSSADDDSYFEDEQAPAATEEEPPKADDEAAFAEDEKEEKVAEKKPVVAAPAEKQREREPEPEVYEKSKRDNSGTYRILGYTFAGVGAAALAGCAATAALMYIKYDEYNAVKASDPNAASKSKAAKKDVKTYYWASIGLGAGAAVSGGLSLMFFLLDGSGSGDYDLDKTEWSATPLITPDATGFAVNGKF